MVKHLAQRLLSQLLRFESSVSPHPEVHRENELLSSKLTNKPIAFFSYFLPMPVRSSKNTIWGGLFLKDDSSEPLFSLVNVVSEKRKKGRKEGIQMA